MDEDIEISVDTDISWSLVPGADGYILNIGTASGLYNLLNGSDVGNITTYDPVMNLPSNSMIYVSVIPYDSSGNAIGCTEEHFTTEYWADDPETFKLTYKTDLPGNTTNNQLLIQTNNDFSYDYSIDWGDGQTNTNVTTDIIHTYANPGTYTISIIGDFPAPFNDIFSGDGNKLLSIDQWGNQNWKSMERAFNGAGFMKYNAVDLPDLSNVSNMSYMFNYCNDFNGNINSWNVTSVTDMQHMFSAAANFNQPLDNWDVSSVTNMGSMFNAANSFNQPLNSWDVSSVTTMISMFRNALNFNQPIGNWDVSSVSNMRAMFSNAENFNQPIGNWDVSLVSDMGYMFSNAENFNQPLDNWDVSLVSDMGFMFNRANSFNQPINSWNVTSVTDMQYMFANAPNFDQPLDNWDVSSVTNMGSMFNGANSFNQPLNSWDVSSVTRMDFMFYRALSFNEPIDNWDVSSVTNMGSMFNAANSFNQPLNSWDVSSVSRMNYMFNGATNFDQPLNSWNTAALKNTSFMFRGAISFNQALDNWDFSLVGATNYMFSDALSFNQPLNGWNTSSVVNMSNMFSGAISFNQYLGDWDLTNTVDVSGMLDNTAMSVTYYDNTLIAWSGQILEAGLNLGANGLQFCFSSDERQSIMNDFGWTITGDIFNCPIPDCTAITNPLDGDSNIPLDITLTWDSVKEANGYYLTVGSSPGGTNILDHEDVGNTTTYDLPSDLPPCSTIYVTITPFNPGSTAIGCTEVSFSTISDTPDAGNDASINICEGTVLSDA
ncbi:BspA family leucine-rich repeat surface protein, partial [Flagellimonas lutimaris]